MSTLGVTKRYDVIIIGAGIGGLICACYLIRRGLKVLLIEKNKSPGGYCNSISIQGRKFDGCVHSFGDLSPMGNFRSLLEELEIFEECDFVQHNPIDTIVTPDSRFIFYSSSEQTVQFVEKSFPREVSNFKKFVKLVHEQDQLKLLTRVRNKSFGALLDEIFLDEKIKRMLALPTFGNIGVCAEQLNAFTAVKHYKSFLFDGGYYPTDGVQAVADQLLSRFEDMGGCFLSSTYVNQILTERSTATGVTLRNRSHRYKAKVIVSACDARTTFLDLVGEGTVGKDMVLKLGSMAPAVSLFTVYIGLKNCSQSLLNQCNQWYMYDYDYDSIACVNELPTIRWMMILPRYEDQTLLVFTSAPYVPGSFWPERKQRFLDDVMQRLEDTVPGITSLVDFAACMTPQGLQKWTNNSYGSPYGWAYTKNQFMDVDFLKDRIVKNLFLCGHWNTVSSGVSGVAIGAKHVSDVVYKRVTKSIWT